MSVDPWLGRDDHGGVPSQARPDRMPPRHWRLDAVYATGRPHHQVVSPDGSTVAFVLSSGAESDIHLVEIDGSRARRLTTDRALAPYWEDSGPLWSPDGSLIAYDSAEHVYIVSSDGGPPNRLPGVRLGAWLDDDRLVVIVERNRASRLAVVDIDDPWPRPFGPKGGDVSQVRVTGDGRVLATFWPREDKSRSDIVVATPEGEWRTLVGHEGRRSLDTAVHGDKVAYVTEEGDWRAVYLIGLDGSDNRLIAKDDADFGDLAWSLDGSRLAAIRYERGQGDLVVISADGSVEAVSVGGFWQHPQWSPEGIVAVQEAHDQAPRLALTSGPADVTLYDPAPMSVRAAPHVRFERVSFRSSDGLEIEGFLFRPEDAPGPVPAVVYPHGGPTSVYGDEWDGHAQYFVDKGYGWFAINFRGSITYGLGFERANHDDWGVGDTEDCIAAGKYLQGLDWVDPNRLAIFGPSYGSYMALTSMVHPENPFACGVLKYGDCDILTGWAQGDRPGSEDLERMMGHPSANRRGYRAGSPIHQVDRLERPLLIAHGEQDARVHLKQAEELVAALDRTGKQYEYITYPREAHGFLRRESQLHFYRRLERFLDWHLI